MCACTAQVPAPVSAFVLKSYFIKENSLLKIIIKSPLHEGHILDMQAFTISDYLLIFKMQVLTARSECMISTGCRKMDFGF